MTTSRFSAILLCFSVLLTSSVFAEIDFAVKLKTRTFTPDQISLQNKSLNENVGKHIMIQFDHPITDDERDQLFSEGIELLDYIPNFTYTAKLHEEIDPSIIEDYDIRWLDKIDAYDKISPFITDHGIGDWARRDGGRVQFTINMHRDVDIYEWADKFQNDFDAEIIGFEPTTSAIVLVLPEVSYFRMSDFDEVLWIEQAMPPQEENNNSARANTGADVLQSMPLWLNGTGVTVAEWDGGHADFAHGDLSGRVQYGDNASVSTHATHVAGTVIGSGIGSTGGLYKGMAPSAKIVSFLWWGNSASINTEYSIAIDGHGAKISTNSWGLGVGDPASESSCQSTLGNYFSECATIDNTIRGELSAPITILWSAGNQRGSSSKYCGSIGWDYGTIGVYGTSKNTITVGAINSNNSTMTSFSSWGPCDDGRIKPDVVGPGCQSNDDGGLTSCKPGSGYTTMCGTSMSTPAVAGTAALLLQHWKNTFYVGSILPSTLKGILINSAEDLGYAGPDYQYGHGKVDGIMAAAKIAVGEPSYFESVISTSIVHLYDLTVPSSAEKLRVTLVWDDPGGTASAAATLINDLDLTLIDPFSNEELPWVLNPVAPFSPATKGVDNTNNVETVEIFNPTPGLWKAKVSGFNIPDGPQKYSLVFTPDSIHTPGNLNALAVFPSGDLNDQPGEIVPVEYWVTNVGTVRDSLTISITDNNGWLLSTVDSVIALDPWDSAYVNTTALIPSGSIAGDLDSVFCDVASLINDGVNTRGRILLSAGAYYGVSVAAPVDVAVNSPEINNYIYNVINEGNNGDLVTIVLEDDLGWIMNPAYRQTALLPFENADFDFDLTIPAEVPDQTENNIRIRSISSTGVADTAFFKLTVDNPFLPPSLSIPSNNSYSQDGTSSFEWANTGETYSLYIATDESLTSIVHSYFGITEAAFTIPSVDSLSDGRYYWGVKLFVGTDSSSLQANPGTFIIDNQPPNSIVPISPINGEFIRYKLFSFDVNFDLKASTIATAPEYNIVQLASDSLFTTDFVIYDPVNSFSFTIPDTVAEGRWYWRVQRADSAGNINNISEKTHFILDSEKPPVAVQEFPLDGAQLKDSVTFKWSRGGELPAYEVSPEIYRFQLFENATDLVFDSMIYQDSLILDKDHLVNGKSYLWRLRAQDVAGNNSTYQTGPFEFSYIQYQCGNIDGLGTEPTISDLTFLVDYLFAGGAAPDPKIAGSVNCDAEVGISDVTYYVEFMFNNGPPPCCEFK